MTVIDETLEEAPQHPSQRRRGSPLIAPNRDGTMPAGRVIVMLLAALLVASLLSADTLVRVAEQQPFGFRRDAALFLARPVRSVSHAFGLHLPRQWLADLTGNEDLPASATGADIDVASGTTTTPTTPRAAPPVQGGLDDKAEAATTTTVPPVTTTTLPPRRVPTPEAPLRIGMYGDSLMGNIAAGFGRLVRGDARIALLPPDFHVSTGLARPDVLDWPAYLQQVLPNHNPEIVYLQFGANDDQPMLRPDGSVAGLYTPEWREEYARRVGLAMDVAGQGDRSVIWIGLPAEGPPQLNAVKDVMNDVAREQASLRPRVVFIDTIPVLSPGGGYSEEITTPDGRVVDTRAGDDVHLSEAGADLLAPALYGAIAIEWNLVPPPPPPPPPETTTTTAPATTTTVTGPV